MYIDVFIRVEKTDANAETVAMLSDLKKKTPDLLKVYLPLPVRQFFNANKDGYRLVIKKVTVWGLICARNLRKLMDSKHYSTCSKYIMPKISVLILALESGKY